MTEYQKKLAAFRYQQKKIHFLNQCKINLWKRPISFISSVMPAISAEHEKLLDKKSDSEVSIPDEDSFSSGDDVDKDEDSLVEEKFSWFRFSLSILIWIAMFSFSVYIEFGVIFLILSGFYVIWTNTRTGPRQPNEISAYSVFNPNCEPIEGTLDAKKLESEMVYGMMF